MKLQIWLPLCALIFLIGGFLHNPFLVAFAVSAAIILLLAFFWNKHVLDHIEYKRRWHYTKGFPGEESEVKIEVKNKKFLPVTWLRITDLWPRDVPPTKESQLRHSHILNRGRILNLVSLRWFEKIKRRFTFVFKNRGVYPVGPVELSSGDIFGLYDNKVINKKEEYLTVYPKIIPIQKLEQKADNPIGSSGSKKQIFEDPNRIMGVREYRPEDEFRRVHWPATARTGEMQVKIYQPVVSKVLVICMNLATSPHPWLGIERGLSEYIISVTASMAYEYDQKGYAVGLISNASLMQSDQPFKIAPSRSPQHLSHLLESLARVTMFSNSSFEKYISISLPHLAFGSSLLVVTAVITPELSKTLIRLKKHKPNITLISLAKEEPPELPGIKTVHLPYEEEE